MIVAYLYHGRRYSLEDYQVCSFITLTSCGAHILCTRAFECILGTDRSTYGIDASYTLDKNNNDFQNLVDDVLTAAPICGGS